jgi:hypothetical protein
MEAEKDSQSFKQDGIMSLTSVSADDAEGRRFFPRKSASSADQSKPGFVKCIIPKKDF